MSNTDLWDKLAKTDPAHTKEFTRAGGFKGKAIKPIYTERKMTEVFGPCGTGWGIYEPQFTTIPAGDDILVYCTVIVWYERDGKTRDLVGVGGDVVLKKNKDGKLVADDEAFKKAFTDAIGNAMKHLGMSADVHMGRHDDNKYVSELRREIAEQAEEPDDRSPQQICDDFLDMVRDITDRDEYVDTWNANKTSLKRIQRASPPVYNQFIKDLSAIIGPKGFNESKEESGAVSGETPPPANDPKGTDKGSNGADKKTAEVDAKAKKKADEIIAAIHRSPTLGDASSGLFSEGLADIDDGVWRLDDPSPLDWLSKARPAEFQRIKDAYAAYQVKELV